MAKTAEKTYPLGPHIPIVAHIREYPRGQNIKRLDKSAFFLDCISEFWTESDMSLKITEPNQPTTDNNPLIGFQIVANSIISVHFAYHIITNTEWFS